MRRKGRQFGNRQNHQELNEQIGEAREKFTENLLIGLQLENKIDDFVHFEKNSPPDRKGIDFKITTRGRRVVYLDVKSSFEALWKTLMKKRARKQAGSRLDETPIICYIPDLSDSREEKERLLSLIKNNRHFKTALNG